MTPTRHTLIRTVACVAGVVLLLAAASILAQQRDNAMNTLAEQYVRLVLAVGQHDTDYVDAYYGPPAWRTEAETAKAPLSAIASRAAALAEAIAAAAPGESADELV